MSRVGTALFLALGLGAMSDAALADRALVIGAPEPERRGLLRPTSGVDPAEALRGAGFEVITADAGAVAAMRAALSAFLDGIEEQPRVVVLLSGDFVRANGRSWLLEAGDGARPDLATVDDVGLSVQNVLDIAGRVPGGAVVALEQKPDPRAPGAGLEAGIATAEIPQGVTVLKGRTPEVARFVATNLLTEGQPLAQALSAAREVEASGFLPQGLAFLPMGEERPVAPPDAAEVERAIWQAARAQDTLAAYDGYLDRYPEGYFAEEARQAQEAIRTEPHREARLAEEALTLSRDDRRRIQRQLTLLGFEPRGVDGVFGAGSRAAIERFQLQNGFPATGFLETRQIERLTLQAERKQAELDAEERREALERERQDRAAWAAVGENGDEAGLETYLEHFPDGRFAPIARERLAAIEAAQRSEEEAQDRRDWQAAETADTKAAYRAYLESHPKGLFASTARDKIAAEAPEETAKKQEQAARRQAFRETENQLGLNEQSRRLVEVGLGQAGYDPGPVDGTFDTATRKALRAYQGDNGLAVTGFVNRQVITRMLADFSGLSGLTLPAPN